MARSKRRSLQESSPTAPVTKIPKVGHGGVEALRQTVGSPLHRLSGSDAVALRLEHLGNVVKWASSRIPSLGAFLGERFASSCESAGMPAPTCIRYQTCKRCESFLQPGVNYTVRIAKSKKRRRKGRQLGSVSKVLQLCHFCKYGNSIPDTAKRHVKSKIADMSARRQMNMMGSRCSPTSTLSPIFPETTGNLVSPSAGVLPRTPPLGTVLTGDLESSKSGNKRKRKGWSNLKDLTVTRNDQVLQTGVIMPAPNLRSLGITASPINESPPEAPQRERTVGNTKTSQVFAKGSMGITLSKPEKNFQIIKLSAPVATALDTGDIGKVVLGLTDLLIQDQCLEIQAGVECNVIGKFCGSLSSPLCRNRNLSGIEGSDSPVSGSLMELNATNFQLDAHRGSVDEVVAPLDTLVAADSITEKREVVGHSATVTPMIENYVQEQGFLVELTKVSDNTIPQQGERTIEDTDSSELYENAKKRSKLTINNPESDFQMCGPSGLGVATAMNCKIEEDFIGDADKLNQVRGLGIPTFVMEHKVEEVDRTVISPAGRRSCWLAGSEGCNLPGSETPNEINENSYKCCEYNVSVDKANAHLEPSILYSSKENDEFTMTVYTEAENGHLQRQGLPLGSFQVLDKSLYQQEAKKIETVHRTEFCVNYCSRSHEKTDTSERDSKICDPDEDVVVTVNAIEEAIFCDAEELKQDRGWTVPEGVVEHIRVEGEGGARVFGLLGSGRDLAGSESCYLSVPINSPMNVMLAEVRNSAVKEDAQQDTGIAPETLTPDEPGQISGEPPTATLECADLQRHSFPVLSIQASSWIGSSLLKSDVGDADLGGDREIRKKLQRKEVQSQRIITKAFSIIYRHKLGKHWFWQVQGRHTKRRTQVNLVCKAG